MPGRHIIYGYYQNASRTFSLWWLLGDVGLCSGHREQRAVTNLDAPVYLLLIRRFLDFRKSACECKRTRFRAILGCKSLKFGIISKKTEVCLHAMLHKIGALVLFLVFFSPIFQCSDACQPNQQIQSCFNSSEQLSNTYDENILCHIRMWCRYRNHSRGLSWVKS